MEKSIKFNLLIISVNFKINLKFKFYGNRVSVGFKIKIYPEICTKKPEEDVWIILDLILKKRNLINLKICFI